MGAVNEAMDVFNDGLELLVRMSRPAGPQNEEESFPCRGLAATIRANFVVISTLHTRSRNIGPTLPKMGPTVVDVVSAIAVGRVQARLRRRGSSSRKKGSTAIPVYVAYLARRVVP